MSGEMNFAVPGCRSCLGQKGRGAWQSITLGDIASRPVLSEIHFALPDDTLSLGQEGGGNVAIAMLGEIHFAAPGCTPYLGQKERGCMAVHYVGRNLFRRTWMQVMSGTKGTWMHGRPLCRAK